MFCYSNNGYSMRAVDGDYVAQGGEVLFAEYATEEEKNTVFQLYNNGVPALTKSQKLVALSANYKAQVTQINALIMTAVVVTKDSATELANRNLLEQTRLEYNINVGVIKNGG